MSYGVNQNDLDRRAATCGDKILKGVKPAIYCGAAKEVRVHQRSAKACANSCAIEPSFDSRIGVAPMFRRAPISGPCFAYSVPAGKSDSAVDHQNSPVAPIIVAQQFPRKNDPFSFDTMKVFHLTSGVLHRCDDIGGRFIRSEAVEENIDLYACSAGGQADQFDDSAQHAGESG
jgi:hypothetical protein